MDLNAPTLDARGRPLEEGDEIIFSPQRGQQIYFRVANISPAVDPKLPADALMVHIVAAIPFMVQRGRVNPEFIRVRTLGEAGPMNITSVEPAPPPPGEGSQR